MKTIFLDRDGVINKDFGYVHTWNMFEFLPDVIDALKIFSYLDYSIIVVTNQSGIARGMYTETDVQALHAQLDLYLKRQGVLITDFYYCPHHPYGTEPDYRIFCNCRKPQPGMLHKAISEHACDLSSSIMVGDKWSDIEAGISAGITQNFLISDRDKLCMPELESKVCSVNSLLQVARILS